MIKTLLSKWPDFTITFLGVFGGGIAAFWVARWQIKQEAKESFEKEREIFKCKFNRVKLELRDNRNSVKQLQRILDKSKNARLDLWIWAKTITNSFSTFAYDDLLQSGLDRHLPKRVEGHLFSSYSMVKGLRDMVKQALAGHEFIGGYQGNNKQQNLLFSNVKTYAQTVHNHLEYCVTKLYKYAEKLSKSKKKENLISLIRKKCKQVRFKLS